MRSKSVVKIGYANRLSKYRGYALGVGGKWVPLVQADTYGKAKQALTAALRQGLKQSEKL